MIILVDGEAGAIDMSITASPSTDAVNTFVMQQRQEERLLLQEQTIQCFPRGGGRLHKYGSIKLSSYR